jgi:acetyl-CoA carboxylase biotin carboxyl carrier protein
MSLERSIQALVRILRDEDLAEIEVRRLFTTIRVRRPGADAAAPVMFGAPASLATGAEPKESEASLAADLVPIKSPMVGTFYRSPAPDADPYVEENTPIDVGQTVCIVEAMKLMNEIESDTDGVVEEVLAANGQPVEYGEVLFRIRPGSSV